MVHQPDENCQVARIRRICSGKWCCQTGLNCRPLHYQWSALPLSYGSVPRIRESAKRPQQGAPILATRPGVTQARETAREGVKTVIIGVGRPRRPSIEPVVANPVPISENPRKSEPESFASAGPPAPPESAIARRASETQYVPAAGRPAGLFLSDIIWVDAFEQADDDE